MRMAAASRLRLRLTCGAGGRGVAVLLDKIVGVGTGCFCSFALVEGFVDPDRRIDWHGRESVRTLTPFLHCLLRETWKSEKPNLFTASACTRAGRCQQVVRLHARSCSVSLSPFGMGNSLGTVARFTAAPVNLNRPS